MEVRDQLHRLIELTHTPRRIISLVPSQTELLVDLGLRDLLVGITKFCIHPSNLKSSISVVGGTKNIQIEKIRSLNPDLVICNKEENTEEIVKDLSEFVPVYVSDIYEVKDVFEMIASLGAILKAEERAQEINAEIRTEYDKFNTFVKSIDTMKVAYLIWKKPFMAAGKRTFINSLLQMNKFINVCEPQLDRYPEVTLQDLIKADLVLLSTEPYPFKESDVLELKNALHKEVRLVDGEFFSWYGSRLAKAFDYFRTLHA